MRSAESDGCILSAMRHNPLVPLIGLLAVAGAIAPASARGTFVASVADASPTRVEFVREGGQAPPAAQPAAAITAIRAGRLLDPDTGTTLTNQVILVEGRRIREVGPKV